MDGDENYIFFAIYTADFVDSPATFSEWDVAVEAVFEEASVGAAFVDCFGAVAVVDKDFHCVAFLGFVKMLRVEVFDEGFDLVVVLW